MIQIWQVPSECGPSNLVVLGLTLFLPVSESFFLQNCVLVEDNISMQHIFEQLYSISLFPQ